MPAPLRTPREHWIGAGLRALGSGGPDAVRVEALAKALGVTKGGFYAHFAGRRALLEEMLDTWERRVLDDVIERVEAEGDDPRARLQRLAEVAGAVGEFMDVELAVRDWARRDAAVARRVRRIDNRRMEYMRRLFGELVDDEDEVEARCLVALSLFVGGPLIAAEHPGRSRAEVVAHVLRRLEERPDGRS